MLKVKITLSLTGKSMINKIADIEKRLKDKQYSQFLKQKADEEVEQIAQYYKNKRQQQNKYLQDLQQQEKQYKLLRKSENKMMNF